MYTKEYVFCANRVYGILVAARADTIDTLKIVSHTARGAASVFMAPRANGCATRTRNALWRKHFDCGSDRARTVYYWPLYGAIFGLNGFAAESAAVCCSLRGDNEFRLTGEESIPIATPQK